MKVLVADDDADVREVTAELLGRRGFEVTTVTTGHEASAALAKAAYDVAVLDQSMPPGSGMEVAAERRAAGDSIPIVLWTGWAGTLDPDEVERLDVRVLDKSDVGELSADEGAGRAELTTAQPSRSMIVTLAWPPPSHIVWSP